MSAHTLAGAGRHSRLAIGFDRCPANESIMPVALADGLKERPKGVSDNAWFWRYR
jgi:hypothetical protein